MAQQHLLPLALLYTDRSREIDGATKFQKLVFLAQEETNLGSPFEYESEKYGPFSAELAATLSELERRGLIEKDVRTNRSGKDKHHFRLTDEGQSVVRRLKDESDAFDDVLDAAHELKQDYNNMSLDQILKYVYSNYPGYTGESRLDEFKPT